MIIATFGIAQASLALLSLNAIIQGCVRFAQKTNVCRLKSFKLLASFGRNSNKKDFLTPAALVFWLTARGQS
jgi:hypothetical protein